MVMDKKRIEGPFDGAGGRFPDYLNKCGFCGEEIKGDKEYRRTWSEDLFKKTGGREGKTYYCVPCGEKISIREGVEESKEQEKFFEQKIKNARETIDNCFTIISPFCQKLLAQKKLVLTVEDYKKVKGVQERIKKLGNFEDPIVKWDVENLKKSSQNLIDKCVSPKNRRIGNSKRGHAIHSSCCVPRNIKLEKNDSEQYYYCDYCWETESPYFLKSLKSYLLDKLNKKMLDNGISSFELNSSNYQSMLTVPDFLLTQTGIQDAYQQVEKDLQDLLKKKGININNDNYKEMNTHTHTHTEREREREREQNQSQQSQLLSEISNLEQKSSKTPQQEQDLERKKQELEKLQKKEKELFTSLPLENKISILEKEIKDLEKKENKSREEETLLKEKRQELERLLEEKGKENSSSNSENNKDKGDKTALYIGLGIVGVVLIGLVVVLVRRSKKKKHK